MLERWPLHSMEGYAVGWVQICGVILGGRRVVWVLALVQQTPKVPMWIAGSLMGAAQETEG